MTLTNKPVVSDGISLNDRWTVGRGRVFMNGTHALARILLAQKQIDAARGLNTAGYISGYRGSPLGNVDTTLWSISDRLADADITFVPGVNEDMAATAVRGTQQLDSVPDPLVDGVFGAWYGKGPGVDRSGDAFKHGNFVGAHRNGGVVIFYGDDHGGKSSTVSHHSEQAMAGSLIPSLYPADVGEILEYGLLAYAMSRYSGSWVGLKLVNEIVEQTASVAVDVDGFTPVLPDHADLPPEGIHARKGDFNPLRDEQIVVDYRLPLVAAFVRANRIDRTEFRAARPRLGLVSAGKSYGDTRQALKLLGLDDSRAAALGISLYKVGCIWPLENEGLRAFARDHRTLFVIEEKKSFVEAQAAAALINQDNAAKLVGKQDEDGKPLLSGVLQLESVDIALAIVDRLGRLGPVDPALLAEAQSLSEARGLAAPAIGLPRRKPFFCSGCPHNRSTRVPEGSLSMTGIGCHTMATFVRPETALTPTHMGGEGGNWIGLAPYTATRHMFQNMGDGTYYHSGLLAIRAAVASGVNITYKILYNDAVAMTGGQPVDGPISVAEIAQQVRHEGIGTIWVLSDNPDAHRDNPGFPAGVKIGHRDEIDTVQRELRETPGCSILIYEQTCAAEKRRRRKRGRFPNPPKRLFIASAVCEGCGDCSTQSTCVSLLPLETELGTKRAIDQANCNKDYSCLNGFCPSFITVHGAEPRKPRALGVDPALLRALPAPSKVSFDAGSVAMIVAGIGGTGVTTVSAIIGMAAHIDGRAVSLFDMTGLAQKNGAVFSHIRIAADPNGIHTQKIGRGEADALIAFDLVAAMADEARSTFSSGRTRALINTDVAPTADFQFDRSATVDVRLLQDRLTRLVGEEQVCAVNATGLAATLFGDPIASNMFLVGAAVQQGLLPIGIEALERAIRLNGAAVEMNLAAFRTGRLFIVDPGRVSALVPATPPAAAPMTLDDLVAHRAQLLAEYQGPGYAARYHALMERVRRAEAAAMPGHDALARAIAHNYAKLLAYKDEYEVARLLTDPRLRSELANKFEAGARFELNMAPPVLGGRSVNGCPRKRAFSAHVWLPVLTVLKHFRRLRGTPFDPFGYTAERRMERALIAQYEALVDELLAVLGAANHAAAIRLASLADMIRGYGPVKQAAHAQYEEALAASRRAFHDAGSVNDVAA